MGPLKIGVVAGDGKAPRRGGREVRCLLAAGRPTNANNETMKERSRRQSARNEEARGCLESIKDEQGANARGREACEAREVRNVRTVYTPNDNDNDNQRPPIIIASSQLTTNFAQLAIVFDGIG